MEEWRENRIRAIAELNKLADELDEMERDVNIAKIAGSATSIAFGIGSAVAGIVSFFTFGAAVPVSIALGVVAGTGGLTTAGSTIVKGFIEKSKLETVQKLLNDDNRLTENLKTTFEKLKEALEIILSITNTAAINLGPTIGKELVRAVGNVGDDVLTASCRAFTPFSRVASIAGPVIGLAIVPFDLYILVTSINAIDKKLPSTVANELRKHAGKMQQELDAMLNSL